MDYRKTCTIGEPRTVTKDQVAIIIVELAVIIGLLFITIVFH
jgi:hypothetical protein